MKSLIAFFACYFILVLNSTAQLGAWVPVGDLNANATVNILLKGNSGELYAGGYFTDATGKPYVARWDGTNWTQLGSGLGYYTYNTSIWALAQDNAGNLYAAGAIEDTFKVGASQFSFCYVAKWDGTKWTKLGSGLNLVATSGYLITSLTVDNNGNVYAAGNFYDSNSNFCVMKWNGSTWSQIGNTNLKKQFAYSTGDGIFGIKVDQFGGIYITGGYTIPTNNSYIYKWDGSNWIQLGTEQTTSWSNTSLVINSSGTPFAAVSAVSKWTGSGWNAIDVAYKYGPLAIDNSDNIYASTFYGVSKWNGSSWSNVGTNNNAFANMNSVIVDNSGSVYVTGPNTKSNGIYYVATWDPNAVAAPTVNSTVSLCQNVTASALSASGTNLTWYTAATGGTGSSTAPVPSTSTIGSTTHYVSQTISGREGPRASITVTVLAVSPPPTVTPAVNYCQNATASPLSATGSSIVWSNAPTGGYSYISNPGPVPITTSVGTTVYYVSQNTTGCRSPRVPITVNVYAIPSAPAVTSPLSYCQNSIAPALTATGSSLSWYTVSSGGASTPTLIPSTASAGTSTYWVSQTVSGCTSPRAFIDVSVTALPPAPQVTSPINYCLNDATTALAASGTSLLWYTTSNSIGSSTAPVPTSNTAGTSTYYVSETANGCESTLASIDVTVSNPAAPSVTSPINYCLNGSTSSLSATGTSLLWYSTLGGTGDVVPPIPTSDTEGTTTYYVSQTVNGCTSPLSVIDVFVNPLPDASIAPSSALSICNSGGRVLLMSSAGSSYEWYNGTTLLGTNQGYYATVGGSYTVIVTDALGCTNTSAALIVTQSSQNCYDCAGVIDGTAALDNCDVCSGGTTGITPCTITSITNLTQNDNILIFPQPFTSTTMLQLKSAGQIQSFFIYNSSGIIESTASDLNTNEIEIGSELKAGIYTIIVQTDKGSYVVKLSKIK